MSMILSPNRLYLFKGKYTLDEVLTESELGANKIIHEFLTKWFA